MNGIMIFRLSKTEIVVDDVLFIKGKFGTYRAEEPMYRKLNVFRNYIDAFLKAEEVMYQAEFEDELEEMLFYTGIDYPEK